MCTLCVAQAPTLYGFDLNITAAGSFTCACEGIVGTVMLWFAHDIFLAIAQDNFDGRNDASLLRFDRAEAEAAVAACPHNPLAWFAQPITSAKYPATLLLPREFEPLPSQRKRERSMGWHMAA